MGPPFAGLPHSSVNRSIIRYLCFSGCRVLCVAATYICRRIGLASLALIIFSMKYGVAMIAHRSKIDVPFQIFGGLLRYSIRIFKHD